MAHRIAEVLPDLPTLRTLRRGEAMVPDYVALKNPAGGMRRFLGHKNIPNEGPEFTDARDGKVKRHGGFARLADLVIEIAPTNPHYGEYIRHLKDGDLWAADQVTADAARVLYEPSFGGEHPEMAQSDEAKACAAKREALTAKHTAEAVALDKSRGAVDAVTAPIETSK